jgi:hypothetical protein
MSKGVKYQCQGRIKYYNLWKFDEQELIDNFETWKQNKTASEPTFKVLDEGSRIKLCREIIKERVLEV